VRNHPCLGLGLGLGAPGGKGGVVPARKFGLESVPDLAWWLEADALSLSEGASVASWTDLSGCGRHATQSTTAKKPTFRTGAANQLPAIAFDGGDYVENAEVGALLAGAATPFTVFVVARRTGSGAFGSAPFLQVVGGGNPDIYLTGSEAVGAAFGRDDDSAAGQAYTSGLLTDTSLHRYVGRYTGTASELYRDGVLLGSDDSAVGAVTVDTALIGAYALAGTIITGLVGLVACVVLYLRSLTLAELHFVDDILDRKYGRGR
jgi:hypothetical protein